MMLTIAEMSILTKIIVYVLDEIIFPFILMTFNSSNTSQLSSGYILRSFR
jgi:hypothetical protein